MHFIVCALFVRRTDRRARVKMHFSVSMMETNEITVFFSSTSAAAPGIFIHSYGPADSQKIKISQIIAFYLFSIECMAASFEYI